MHPQCRGHSTESRQACTGTLAYHWLLLLLVTACKEKETHEISGLKQLVAMLPATLQMTREERPWTPGHSSQGKMRVEQLLSKDLSNMREFRASSRLDGKEPTPHILSRSTERMGQVSQLIIEPLLCKSGLL